MEKRKKCKKIKSYFAWIYAKLIFPKINLVKIIYFIVYENGAHALKTKKLSKVKLLLKQTDGNDKMWKP